MNNKGKKYNVIEDNGGGLMLVVFNENKEVEYMHSGYEYFTGQLSADILELKSTNSTDEWDGNEGESNEERTLTYVLIKEELEKCAGYELVADNEKLYVNDMGRNALIEFGIVL